MPIYNDYLSISKGLNPEEILKDAKNRIIRGASHKNRDFSKLKTYLNSLFYGPKTKGSLSESLSNAASSHYEDIIGMKFDNYDFEKSFFSSSSSDGRIDLDERTSFSHSKFIQRNTILKRWWEAKNQLETLSSYPDPESKYEQIISDLQQLIQATETLLSDFPFITKNNINLFTVNEYNKDLINRIDELYQKVVFMSSVPLTSQELGEVFEKALKAVGDIDTVDSLTDDILRESFNKKTEGSQVVSRGGIVQLAGIDYKIVESKNKKGSKNIKYEIVGENGSTISIGGEFSPRQGKMDVLFTMPDNHEQFRISAKNWATLDGRDFGSTDLESALMRSGGFINTIAYGVGVGFARSALQNAHDYAKACVILDIVMGYSQESNYADTLVINNRAAARIEVFSIEDLLNKINYNSILGYPENVREDIRSNFNIKRPVGPQGYENAILSTLKSYKLTVSADFVS